MKLTTSQLSLVLDTAIVEHGLNKVLETILNCLMKLERTEFLRQTISSKNKGNGYRIGKAIGLGAEIKLQIPRDRLGQFYPILLTLIRNQEEELHQLAFTLYSKGLSVRDVSDVFDKLYGSKYSKSSVSRINQSFVKEMELWRNRQLDASYPLIMVDAIHTRIRRSSKVEVEAIYTVMGLRSDMSRDILAIESIPQESATGWESLFTSLKDRGLESVNLVIADGLTGLEQSIANVFPGAAFQKCVTHLKRNILNKTRYSDRAEIAADLKLIFVTNDSGYKLSNAIENFENFITKWMKTYPFIRRYRNRSDLIYYFTYLNYDYRIRSMIYTTNWIENLNKQFRRVLKIRNSMPSDESALLLISKIAMDKVEKYLQYPLHSFKFDDNIMK